MKFENKIGLARNLSFVVRNEEQVLERVSCLKMAFIKRLRKRQCEKQEAKIWNGGNPDSMKAI